MPHRPPLFRFLHKAAEYDIKTYGRGGVGVALACRYFDGEPWVSVRDLASDLELSAPQIRRRLENLVAGGKARLMAVSGTYLYALTDEAATAYAEHLERTAAAERISF